MIFITCSDHNTHPFESFLVLQQQIQAPCHLIQSSSQLCPSLFIWSFVSWCILLNSSTPPAKIIVSFFEEHLTQTSLPCLSHTGYPTQTELQGDYPPAFLNFSLHSTSDATSIRNQLINGDFIEEQMKPLTFTSQ